MELYEIQNHGATNDASKIMKLREKLISCRFWENPANRQELMNYLSALIPVENYHNTFSNCLTIKLAPDSEVVASLSFYSYFSQAYQKLLAAHKHEIIDLIGNGRIDDPTIYSMFDRLVTYPNEIGLLYNLQYLADNTIEVIL